MQFLWAFQEFLCSSLESYGWCCSCGAGSDGSSTGLPKPTVGWLVLGSLLDVEEVIGGTVIGLSELGRMMASLPDVGPAVVWMGVTGAVLGLHEETVGWFWQGYWWWR